MTEDELVEAIRAIPGLLPPVSPEVIEEVERVIGYSLPPLLRRLYIEAANGGFGPRDGVLGVAGSEYKHHFEVADIIDSYNSEREDWPGMLWLFDWGCGIWSVMDLRDPAGPMWIWDPNIGEDESTLTPQNMTLAEWLAESLSGNLEKAFQTSNLIAISRRRASFDACLDELEYCPPECLADDEIIAAISELPDLPPTASASAVIEAERTIGSPLPPLLRRLYLEVANGGFGPGRGILGVPTGGAYRSREITFYHKIWNARPDPYVPPGLVWLHNWGTAIWSLVDCRDLAGPMWIWDPMGPYLRPDRLGLEEGIRVDRSVLTPQNMTLAEWLTECLRGSFAENFRPSNLRALAERRTGRATSKRAT
ncbi:SMI1/KNR4 family protein [Microbispora rosea]|uniref:SMI1/KNR4 family protein n=1 Tax=Microbispora rosea TaxID=58117 RepID=UPI003415AEFD